METDPRHVDKISYRQMTSVYPASPLQRYRRPRHSRARQTPTSLSEPVRFSRPEELEWDRRFLALQLCVRSCNETGRIAMSSSESWRRTDLSCLTYQVNRGPYLRSPSETAADLAGVSSSATISRRRMA